MKKNKEYNKKLVLISLFLGVIFIFMLFLLIKPQITGLVVYGENFYIKNWSFNNINDYIYDDSIVVDETVQLAPVITVTYWNTTTETDYQITTVLYNPSDKTEKVNILDNKKHEINNEKIFDIFFNENLENGDIIHIYIDQCNEGNIFLCDKGTPCQTPNYGFAGINEEGWYNITINSLNSPSKIFSLNLPEGGKINFINSTKGVITKALYNPSDKTSKIQNLDNEKFEVTKNKLFNLIFDNSIDNKDIITLYITGGSASELYLCDYGAECDSPGYGSINYDGEEGWYNITVSGLSASKTSFNLDPDHVNIDYIKSIHLDYEEHSSSAVSYASSAEIETEDLEINNLLKFDLFSKNEALNNQTVTYHYSIDSGSNWNEIPEDGNLSNIDISNGKIRIKAILNSDEITTPTLHDLAVSYSIQTIVCTENWEAVYGDCLINNTKLKTYSDSNICNTGDGLPADNGIYTSCDYCSPNWSCVSHGECDLNNVKNCLEAEDNNSCYILTNLSSDSYSGDYNEFNLNCVYNTSGSGFSNLSISLTPNKKFVINQTKLTNALIELNVSSNLNNNFISIINYSENKKNTTPALSALNKYLDIETNESLKSSINSIKLRIDYTDEEINHVNLNENTLKIYYYNETSNEWQELNSIVNTTENYVIVEIDHLSTFGLFGEQAYSESSDDSPGNHGSQRIIKKTSEKKEETMTPTEEVKEEIITKTAPDIEEKAICEYDLDISLPSEISFVEKDSVLGKIRNKGDCDISEVKIDISSNLIGLIDRPAFIENLEKNGVADFILNEKSNEKQDNLLIQGFTIFRDKEIKNYEGELSIQVLENNNLKKEIKIPLNVEVLSKEDTKNKIPLFLMVPGFIVIVLFVMFKHRKRSKIIKKIKKN